MIQTLEPKTMFIESDTAKIVADMVASKGFKHAVSVCLAQFALDLPSSAALDKSCSAHYELVGARKFAFALLNICEPSGPAKNADTALNLDWGPSGQPKPGSVPKLFEKRKKPEPPTP